MHRIGGSKEQMEGFELLPDGVYQFRVDGFAPALTKPKPGVTASVNLNPKLTVINDPKLTDRRIFHNLNEKAIWIQHDLVHACGLQMELNGDQAYMPGGFMPPEMWDKDPTKCQYQGPLMGRTGRLELATIDGQNGKRMNAVKRFLCAVPGCKAKHTEDLLK